MDFHIYLKDLRNIQNTLIHANRSKKHLNLYSGMEDLESSVEDENDVEGDTPQDENNEELEDSESTNEEEPTDEEPSDEETNEEPMEDDIPTDEESEEEVNDTIRKEQITEWLDNILTTVNSLVTSSEANTISNNKGHINAIVNKSNILSEAKAKSKEGIIIDNDIVPFRSTLEVALTKIIEMTTIVSKIAMNKNVLMTNTNVVDKCAPYLDKLGITLDKENEEQYSIADIDMKILNGSLKKKSRGGLKEFGWDKEGRSSLINLLIKTKKSVDISFKHIKNSISEIKAMVLKNEEEETNEYNQLLNSLNQVLILVQSSLITYQTVTAKILEVLTTLIENSEQ